MLKSKFVDIVDENDNVIGQVTEEEATLLTDKITRVIAIFLFNSRGELLLQKRSKNKVRYPLYWDCSVSGFVNFGEDYEIAAVRELKEELGIIKEPAELEFVLKKLIKTDRIEFTKLYKLKYDGLIKINKSEIDSVEFFLIRDIKKMINSNEKFSPFFVTLFSSIYV